ncbi:hypothetical protein [Nostoc mirabile]|nr:hypothetical protein [Nostoc mirabile]
MVVYFRRPVLADVRSSVVKVQQLQTQLQQTVVRSHGRVRE